MANRINSILKFNKGNIVKALNDELGLKKDLELEKNAGIGVKECNAKDSDIKLASLKKKFSAMQKNYFSIKKELAKTKSELTTAKANAEYLKRASSKNNIHNSVEKLNHEGDIKKSEILKLKNENMELSKQISVHNEKCEANSMVEKWKLELAEDEIRELKIKVKRYEMKLSAFNDLDKDSSSNSTSFEDLSQSNNSFLDEGENAIKKKTDSSYLSSKENLRKSSKHDEDEAEHGSGEKMGASNKDSDSELWGKRINRTSTNSKEFVKQSKSSLKESLLIDLDTMNDDKDSKLDEESKRSLKESLLIDLDTMNDDEDSNMNEELQTKSVISRQTIVLSEDLDQMNQIDEPMYVINDGKLQLCDENLQIYNNDKDKDFEGDGGDSRTKDSNYDVNMKKSDEGKKVGRIGEVIEANNESLDISVFSQYLNVNSVSVLNRINDLQTIVVATLMKLNKEIEENPKFLEENDYLEGIFENLQKFGRHKMVVHLAKSLDAKYFKGIKGINLKKMNKVEKSAAKIEIKHALSKDKQELEHLQQKCEHFNQKRRDSSGVESKFVKLISNISNTQSVIPLNISRLNTYLKQLQSLRYDPLLLINNNYAMETLELCTKCEDQKTGQLAKHIISKNKQLHRDQLDLNIDTQINYALVKQQKLEYQRKKENLKQLAEYEFIVREFSRKIEKYFAQIPVGERKILDMLKKLSNVHVDATIFNKNSSACEVLEKCCKYDNEEIKIWAEIVKADLRKRSETSID